MLNYNKLKLVEELAELSAEILKSINKENSNDEEISLEMGDVKFRFKILEKQMNCKKQVSERVKFKTEKALNYLKEGKYTKKI